MAAGKEPKRHRPRKRRLKEVRERRAGEALIHLALLLAAREEALPSPPPSLLYNISV